MANDRGHHPSALRNRVVILEELQQILPADAQGHVLEIGSGSGAHLEYFTPAFPGLLFHPSERVIIGDAASRTFESSGRVVDASLPNELAVINAVGQHYVNAVAAVALDLLAPFSSYDASLLALQGKFTMIFLVNVLHFTGLPGIRGLALAASKLLEPNGVLVMYGPFKSAGGYEGVASNKEFDAMLKSKNPAFGLVDVDDVVRIGAEHGLGVQEIKKVPANNKVIVMRKLAKL